MFVGFKTISTTTPPAFGQVSGGISPYPRTRSSRGRKVSLLHPLGRDSVEEMTDTPREMELDLAQSQRGMMWLFALKFALDFCSGIVRDAVGLPLRIVYLSAYLLVSLAVAYFVFRAARIIYGIGPALVCGALIFAPCLGTLTVLVLNGTAMDRLRKSGVKSGFFGVDRRELEKLRSTPDEPPPSS
jgi:hypothetical protein